MTFNWQYPNGQEPPSQEIELTSSEAVTGLVATSDSGWLSAAVFPTGTPAKLSMSLDRNGLGKLALGGFPYTGHVTVTGSGGAQVVITVTLANGATSVLSVSSPALAFSTTPLNYQQTLTVSGPAASYTATATSDLNWLSVTPTSGATLSPSANLIVTANPTGLAPGYTYNGSVTISSAGGGTVTVPVTFAVGTSLVTAVTPSQLVFNYQLNVTPLPLAAQTLAINGPAGSAFSATVGSVESAWLSVSANAGTVPASLTVTATPGAFSTNQLGYIYVVVNGQQINVPVALNVSLNNLLTASPNQVTLSYSVGGPLPVAPLIAISSSSGSEPFTATSSGNWLYTSSTGTTPGTVTFSVNPTGLAAGSYTGYILIQSTLTASQLSIPVTLTVSGYQAFYASPVSLSFTSSGGAPPAQTVSVASSAGYPIPFSAVASSVGWLSVIPSTAQTPASLTVMANPAGLAAGTYNGTITITAAGSITGTQTVAVTFTVTQNASLTLSSSSLSFDYQVGGGVPAGQNVTVGSNTGQTLTYNTSTGDSWITASGGGTTPGNLLISVNPAGLSPGTYTGRVSVASAGANNSPQWVNVNLVVTPAPTVNVSPSSLTFSYRLDGAAPGSQSLAVNSSGAALSFATALSAGWLSVSPASGSTPATVNVSVNAAALNPGTYSGTVTVNATAAGGAASSQSIPVTLTVTGPLPTITSVRNAASMREGGVAPGEILVIRGTAIGPREREEAALTSDGFYPSDGLGNTRVLVNGLPAAMLYAQSDEVSAVVPYATGDRPDTFIQVEYRGVKSNAVTLAVVKSAIGLFTANKSGSGPGMFLNDDSKPNTAQAPAPKGTYIILFGTGEGQVAPAVPDGSTPTGIAPKPVLPVSVEIGGVPIAPQDILYIGTPPGQLAGMFQVSAKIPMTVSSGPVAVTVTVGSSSSQPGVTIAVR